MSIAGITVPRAVCIFAVILFLWHSVLIAGMIGVQARIAAVIKNILFLSISLVDMSEKPLPFDVKIFATACPNAPRSLNLNIIIAKKVTTSEIGRAHV